jgi:hypothetical protein
LVRWLREQGTNAVELKTHFMGDDGADLEPDEA